ncbi:MAG TPA: RecX family transcriptional regulator [Ktedonobacterales bacterium]
MDTQKITAIEPQAHHPDRYNISLDGRFAFGLDGAVIVAEGLGVGRELTPDDVTRLQAADDERKLLDAALHFLAPRPRSRVEVRRRLLTPKRNRALPSTEAVDRILDRLEQMGLLDDREFAGFWVENRERFSPRSSRALGQELRQRGVSRETVDAVSDPDRDEERALAAARQRLRAVANADYETFRTRLGQFLLRRGFSYSVARSAVRQLWEETHGEDAGDMDDENDPDGAD